MSHRGVKTKLGCRKKLYTQRAKHGNKGASRTTLKSRARTVQNRTPRIKNPRQRPAAQQSAPKEKTDTSPTASRGVALMRARSVLWRMTTEPRFYCSGSESSMKARSSFSYYQSYSIGGCYYQAGSSSQMNCCSQIGVASGIVCAALLGTLSQFMFRKALKAPNISRKRRGKKKEASTASVEQRQVALRGQLSLTVDTLRGRQLGGMQKLINYHFLASNLVWKQMWLSLRAWSGLDRTLRQLTPQQQLGRSWASLGRRSRLMVIQVKTSWNHSSLQQFSQTGVCGFISTSLLTLRFGFQLIFLSQMKANLFLLMQSIISSNSPFESSLSSFITFQYRSNQYRLPRTTPTSIGRGFFGCLFVTRCRLTPFPLQSLVYRLQKAFSQIAHCCWNCKLSWRFANIFPQLSHLKCGPRGGHLNPFRGLVHQAHSPCGSSSALRSLSLRTTLLRPRAGRGAGAGGGAGLGSSFLLKQQVQNLKILFLSSASFSSADFSSFGLAFRKFSIRVYHEASLWAVRRGFLHCGHYSLFFIQPVRHAPQKWWLQGCTVTGRQMIQRHIAHDSCYLSLSDRFSECFFFSQSSSVAFFSSCILASSSFFRFSSASFYSASTDARTSLKPIVYAGWTMDSCSSQIRSLCLSSVRTPFGSLL